MSKPWPQAWIPRAWICPSSRGRLSIRGEKPGLEQVTAEAYHRNERATGRFHRVIDLPVSVDANTVKADYKDGLLLISLPKSEAAKPKHIAVTVG